MAENGIEMRKMRVEGDKEMPSNGPSDDLPRPMEWVTRVRRHNGCFSLFLAAMAIAFGLYVMQGIYFEDEKASVEEFAHGGNGDTISNDEKNAKIKEALENAKSKGYASGASAANQGGAFNQFHQPGGGKYPFNKNPSQEDLDKWNLSHPNRPYPGLHNGKRPIGNHGKGAGAFGGRPGANSRPIDKKGNHNITKPGGSSNESNQVACEDLSQYQNWFEAVIKKDDGKKYEILQQLEHDQHAFTYVNKVLL